MRRIAAVLGVLTVVLVGLLTVKLQAQEAQLHGPAQGSGEIEGTEVRLASKLSARIVELKVKKGDAVKPGDVLVRLDCADPMQMFAEAQSRLSTAQAQAKASRAQAEAAMGTQQAAMGTQQAASATVTASKAQADALAAQRDASKRQADRLDAVQGDVAFSSRDQIRASAQGLEHQVEAAQASSLATTGQALAAAGQAKAAQAQARAAQAQAESTSLSVQVAEIAVMRAQLLVAECEVKAPREALVEDVPYEVGELVLPGAVLVKLIDLREVKATFYLPNAEIAVARPGVEAQVVADAWPDIVFKGRVTNVALKAEFTPRNIQTRTDRDRLVYPIEVAISNPDLKLRAGMPVQVTLPGTSR